MSNLFSKATKAQAHARIALIGPSGSGKTFTALRLAQRLGTRIAVVDTERGSASKYADQFTFDVLELTEFAPARYAAAIQMASEAGYDVLILDSLSHAWCGKDGALEMVDRAAKKSPSGNTWAAWRDVTPQHNRMVDAIVQAPLHIIATMRAKTEYVTMTDERGKVVPKKVGMAPVQRDGLEYEFDIVGDLDLEHNLIISKTRCSALDGAVIAKPGEELAQKIRGWLTDGVPQPARPTSVPIETTPRAASDEKIEQARAAVKQVAEAKRVNGGGKVASDPQTRFWHFVREHEILRDVALAVLEEKGTNFEEALLVLEKKFELQPA